jgi:SpoVK/Ycf46/Vps4 family AAA+-type ATPase
VFVVASANSVRGLPPELLRKGRFDEVFYVGLPNLKDRASIMAAHLSKYKVRIDEQGSIDRHGLFELAKLTLKYSGAELAAVIKDAAAAAFYAGRAGRVTYEDIYQEIVSFKPLAIREAAQFTELLEWAKSAKPAAEPVEEKPSERSSVLI